MLLSPLFFLFLLLLLVFPGFPSLLALPLSPPHTPAIPNARNSSLTYLSFGIMLAPLFFSPYSSFAFSSFHRLSSVGLTFALPFPSTFFPYSSSFLRYYFCSSLLFFLFLNHLLVFFLHCSFLFIPVLAPNATFFSLTHPLSLPWCLLFALFSSLLLSPPPSCLFYLVLSILPSP